MKIFETDIPFLLSLPFSVALYSLLHLCCIFFLISKSVESGFSENNSHTPQSVAIIDTNDV